MLSTSTKTIRRTEANKILELKEGLNDPKWSQNGRHRALARHIGEYFICLVFCLTT